MTCQTQDTEALSAVELIAGRGIEGLPDALAALINEAMRLERERHLGAGSYERSEERRGYANAHAALVGHTSWPKHAVQLAPTSAGEVI